MPSSSPSTHLAAGLTLADAPFWTPSQVSFLREEVQEDADWAEVSDALDNALRRSTETD